MNNLKYTLHGFLKRFIYIRNIKVYNNIKLAIFFKKNFSDFFYSIMLRNNHIFLNVLLKFFDIFINILKYNTLTLYNQLLDICAVDNLELFNYKSFNRFTLYYNLLSTKRNSRVILKVNPALLLDKYNKLNDQNFYFFIINSLNIHYSSASWLERENWDMFGIFFEGNLDLRRILTDYSFEGFPLRKDFPLSGFFDLNYSIFEKRIILNKLELIQDFRFNTFKNNWI